MGMSVRLARAYLLGVYIGDGHAQWTVSDIAHPVYQFVVPSMDLDLLSKTQRCIKRAFPELRGRIRISTEPRANGKGVLFRLVCHSKRLCRFLIKKTDKKMRLPIFKKPELLKEFVAGLMDTDGWITEHGPVGKARYQMGFATTLPWTETLRKVFQQNGISVGSIQQQQRYNDNWNHCYRMYLNISTFVDAGFYFSIARKQSRIKRWRIQVRGESSTTIRHAPLGK
jgi:hypothetical protein